MHLRRHTCVCLHIHMQGEGCYSGRRADAHTSQIPATRCVALCVKQVDWLIQPRFETGRIQTYNEHNI